MDGIFYFRPTNTSVHDALGDGDDSSIPNRDEANLKEFVTVTPVCRHNNIRYHQDACHVSCHHDIDDARCC